MPNISLLPGAKIKRMQWNRWGAHRKIFWKIVASWASASNDETPGKEVEGLKATFPEVLAYHFDVLFW